MRFLPSPIRFVAVIYSALLVLLSSSRARGYVTIDSFQDSQGPLIAVYGEGIGSFVTSYPHVLGGRGLSLEATTVGLFGGQLVSVNINPTNDPNALEYESSESIAGGVLSLDYGNEYSNIPPVTSLNLNANSPADVLRINFTVYNHANGQDMDINTKVGADDGYTVTIPEALSDPGSQSLDIPLTSFSESTIDYVTFDFIAPPGTSFDLSSIEFVTPIPEPAIISALMLLLLRPQRIKT